VGLESTTYISGLVATNPVVGDDVAQGDDHLRLIKSTLLATFPNVSGAVTPTHTELNYVDGVTSSIQTQIDAKAPTASPTLTGTPAGPTAAVGTSTTQLATTAFVAQGVPGEWVLMQTQTPTAVGQCDIVNGVGGAVISTAYDAYRIEIIDLIPATTSTVLYMRTSTNLGVGFDAGASDYKWMGQYQQSSASTITGVSDAADGQIQLMQVSTTTTTGDAICGTIEAWKLTNAQPAKFDAELVWGNGGVYVSQKTTGIRDTTADVDAIRLLFSSGNIASGVVKFYGRRV